MTHQETNTHPRVYFVRIGDGDVVGMGARDVPCAIRGALLINDFRLIEGYVQRGAFEEGEIFIDSIPVRVAVWETEAVLLPSAPGVEGPPPGGTPMMFEVGLSITQVMHHPSPAND